MGRRQFLLAAGALAFVPRALGFGTGILTVLDDAGSVVRELRVARSSHDVTAL